MPLVDHSGNDCSGKCQWDNGAPCGHVGCWQCAGKAAVAKLVKAKVGKTLGKSILEAMPPGKRSPAATVFDPTPFTPPGSSGGSGSYAEHQTTTVTRAALEGLVSRIPGLYMQWNNGDPILSDKNGNYPLPKGPRDPSGVDRAQLANASPADIEAVAKLFGKKKPSHEDPLGSEDPLTKLWVQVNEKA